MDQTDQSIVHHLYDVVLQEEDTPAGVIDSRTNNYFFDECNDIKSLNESMEVVSIIVDSASMVEVNSVLLGIQSGRSDSSGSEHGGHNTAAATSRD